MAGAGVSQNMKRLALVVALAAIACAVWYLRSSHTSVAAKGTPAAKDTPARPSAAPPIDHVTKLSPAERKALAERIASAQATRQPHASPSGAAATHAPAAPRLPDDLPDDDATPISKTQIRDAMREVIPHLADCYDAAIPTLPTPNIDITATITLSGDPDIGTLIDADQVLFKDGTPLPAKFDDCLRTTFMSLALPPLAEGDKIEIHYPFRFAQQ
ncbi:MAG TPA: hypothetical protein VMZ53_01025 [Kofleriaceae bacterium]|nr:hypothetical protein [Kofleriaceae bacterium]